MTLLLLSLAGGDAFADGARVALVIGNSSYTYAGQLRNPANDAADVAKELRKIGFDVIVELDANRTHMATAIEEFTSRIGGAEAALFYYAGHGIQVANHNYLIPTDVELRANTSPSLSLISLDQIQSEIASKSVGTTILILDACRDNPFAGRAGTRAAAASGLAAVTAGNDTYIAFSTEPGNVAVDGTGRNSPFAEALVKAIPKAGQSLHKAMLAVKQDVRKATAGQQSPWTSDNLPTDFYFVSLPSEPAVVPGEDQEWALVKDTGNTALLQAFLSKWPNGKYASTAQIALTRAAFKQQMEEFKKEFQSQQEIGFWNSVKDTNNPALLQNYLRQYPKGIFAQQAEALLLQIESEQKALRAHQEEEKRRQEQAEKEKDLQRIEAERRAQVEEAKKRADEAKNAAELKRLQEENRLHDLKHQEELKKAQEEVRQAKEAKEQAEAARIAAEKAKEEARSEAKKEGEAAEDRANKEREAEKATEALKEAQRKKDQADKEAAERATEAKKAEETRKAAEEAARLKAIKDAKEAEAKKAADEAARAKALKDAKDAEARKAAEEAAKAKALKDAEEKKEADIKKAQEEASLKQLREEEQKKRDAEAAAQKQRQEQQRNLDEAQRQQEQKNAAAKRAREQQQQRHTPRTVEKPQYRPHPAPRYEAPPRQGGGGGSPPIIHGL
ncbi:MAG: caspase family protein [Rhodomicrobium sp.]